MKVLQQVTILLDRLRHPFRVAASSSGEHAGEIAAHAAETGELPVALGGDGQVTQVADPLVGTDVVMGILPGGRGNDLARGLGIPTDPELAIRALLTGSPLEIDVGIANGEKFLGIASVGFDSRANEIANRTKFVPGGLVYAWSAIRALIGWKAVRFTITTGQTTSRVEAHTVAVANNRFYGSGMEMAPEADLCDGLLDLVVVGDVSRLRFLTAFPRVFRGEHVDGERVTSRQVGSVTISAGEPLILYADGDPLTKLPADLGLIPRGLKVMTPGGGTS